jgi:hypothetical protein
MNTVCKTLKCTQLAGPEENRRVPAWVMRDAGPQPVGGGFFCYPRCRE